MNSTTFANLKPVDPGLPMKCVRLVLLPDGIGKPIPPKVPGDQVDREAASAVMDHQQRLNPNVFERADPAGDARQRL